MGKTILSASAKMKSQRNGIQFKDGFMGLKNVYLYSTALSAAKL